MDKFERSDFYVVLPSNACPQTQPNNTAASYIIDWESALQFPGQWEAALTEYSFNLFPQIIEKQMRINYEYNRKVCRPIYIDVKESKFRINGKENTFKNDYITIKLNSDNKLEFYSEYIPYRITFETYADAISLGFNSEIVKTNDHTLIGNKIKYNVPNFRFNFEIEFAITEIVEDHTIFGQYRLYYDPIELSNYILENCDDIFETFKIKQDGYAAFKFKSNIVKVKFDDEISDKLGIETGKYYTYSQGKEYVGRKRTKMGAKYYLLYIYSSITDPILVGDVRVPLLRQTWVESKVGVGEIIHETIDHPMYLKISSSSINNIEIQLRDDAGRLINFPQGSKTILTVHFRQV